jgi:hypothetical protein
MDYNESYNKLIKYINTHNSTIDETFKLIIIDLLTETNFDYCIFKKILKGAYIIINDGGFFYKKWVLYHKINLKKQEKELSTFYSTHASCSCQYRLGNGIIYDTNNDVTNNYDLLIGTISNKCKLPNTWFQLEKSRLDSLYNTVEHIYNCITYMINNKNIGPFGESSHTEENPIILKLKGALK